MVPEFYDGLRLGPAHGRVGTPDQSRPGKGGRCGRDRDRDFNGVPTKYTDTLERLHAAARKANGLNLGKIEKQGKILSGEEGESPL